MKINADQLNLRPATPADADTVGRIIYQAFGGFAELRNFPHDFPSAEAGVQMAQMVITNPTIYGVVAESDGQIVGSNFLWEQDEIAGVGPITIDPNVQASGVGRKLMQDVIRRGKEGAGIRLVQDAANTVSMSLYASLGFDVKEPLVLIEGSVSGGLPQNYQVRPITEKDFADCGELCRKVHGFSRVNELRLISQMLPSFVAVREKRVVAYASGPNMWQMNHAVAETEEDMFALLLGAGTISRQPLSFLLPTRQSDLFRWCLGQGMRVVKPATLMTMGAYFEPRGCYLPSVLY